MMPALRLFFVVGVVFAFACSSPASDDPAPSSDTADSGTTPDPDASGGPDTPPPVQCETAPPGTPGIVAEAVEIPVFLYWLAGGRVGTIESGCSFRPRGEGAPSRHAAPRVPAL